MFRTCRLSSVVDLATLPRTRLLPSVEERLLHQGGTGAVVELRELLATVAVLDPFVMPRLVTVDVRIEAGAVRLSIPDGVVLGCS